MTAAVAACTRFDAPSVSVCRATELQSLAAEQITLYDLRATGITWRCLRKDYRPEIQQAAGHEKYDMTDGYIPHRTSVR